MTQDKLDLKTQSADTVECLGQTFISEDARREHFLKLLAEKLKDPEFRNIEGFPIGQDEDILALSDPPYYTACPNPWIGDFLLRYGTPYDPEKPYHREPFAGDVTEGKNHPIYNAHAYHTKVPHRAIMRYILHYTEPGDVIFDGFAGTGMAGVAAQFCGDRAEVQALGYRVCQDGGILDEQAKPFSKLGARRAILNDLSPVATFIAYNYNAPVDVDVFEREAKRILKEVEAELEWMYETKHTDGKAKGHINFTVWSEVFSCPECGGEINFLNDAFDDENNQVRNEFPCPHCDALLRKKLLKRTFETILDKRLGKSVQVTKRRASLINYTVGKHVYEKEPDPADLAVLQRIERTKPDSEIPLSRMMLAPDDVENWGDKWRAGTASFTHVHHLFLPRPAAALALIWKRVSEVRNLPLRRILQFTFEQGIWGMSLLNRYVPAHYSQVNRYLNGVYYIPSQTAECSLGYIFNGKIKRLARALATLSRNRYLSILATGDAGRCTMNASANSVDYVFTDPPFGDNLAYSELNFLIEVFHRVFTDNRPEAIVSAAQKKGIETYRTLMEACFREYYRVLKPGRWITIEFSNTRASVWNSIQTALQEVGFVVGNVAALDKLQGTFNAVVTTTSVKQDLVISAYKPNGGLEERFAKRGETEEGAWDFIKTHLRNLAVVKAHGGHLEFIVERDARILYDRMVAFYVGHSTPVPLSSAEFQAGLAERFPQRDEMFFLPEQVNEYDRKRQQMEGVGQLTIFVEDERSAVAWLRNFLSVRPSVYQDIQPEFMQQLGASWKKWETRPELRALLDQNFLCFEGVGEVPSQIHAYLSTQFKELRNLAKEHPQLRHKAKDRWYVPDPKRNIDLEKLRTRRLLEEFWTYLPSGYSPVVLNQNRSGNLPGLTVPVRKIPKGKKLKELRTEAVRVGFKHCYQAKDYQTIVVVAELLPESVIQEDEALQMYYDTAVTRTGGD
jgi:DNA modification methylase